MLISQLKTEKDLPNLWLEHIAQNTARSGMTTKIPPLFGGSTSWFKKEELMAGWWDLTVLEAEKTRASTEQTCSRRRNAQGTSGP